MRRETCESHQIVPSLRSILNLPTDKVSRSQCSNNHIQACNQPYMHVNEVHSWSFYNAQSTSSVT